MEIGTGIFLGSIFLGLIALFAITKDRWKWKRIFLWFLGAIALVVVGIGGWIYFFDIPRARVVSEFWDLKLGMTEADVKFRKGEPGQKDGSVWVYITDKTSPMYIVDFRGGSVSSVVGVQGEDGSLPYFQNISQYTTQEELEKRYGKPDEVFAFSDGLWRRLAFNRYNLVLGLRLNRVEEVGMFDGSDPPFRHGFADSKARK